MFICSTWSRGTSDNCLTQWPLNPSTSDTINSYCHTFCIHHKFFSGLSQYDVCLAQTVTFDKWRKLRLSNLFAHNWQIENVPETRTPTCPSNPAAHRLYLTALQAPGQAAQPGSTGERCFPTPVTPPFPRQARSTFIQQTRTRGAQPCRSGHLQRN